jgi:hypothetical protein
MEDQAPAQKSLPLPGSLLAVGVILLVLGVLAALGAGIIFLLAALGSAAPAEFGVPAPPEMVGAFMAFVIGIGVLATIDALAHFVIGVGVLRRRGWARVGGLVIAVLGIILTLVLSAWSLVPQTFVDPVTGLPYEPTVVDFAINTAISGASIVAYIFVVIVLARRGRDFS